MVIAKVIVNKTSLRIVSKQKIPRGLIGGKVEIEYADRIYRERTKVFVV